MADFLVLGLGMAAPWLFVALFPQTAALLPRPGRWMNTLKMALGVMMLASSLWPRRHAALAACTWANGGRHADTGPHRGGPDHALLVARPRERRQHSAGDYRWRHLPAFRFAACSPKCYHLVAGG